MSKFLHALEDNTSVSFEQNDYIQASGTLPKSLLVTIDATHAGYRNRNFFHYDSESMRYAVDNESWTKPFPKPLLKNHDMDSEPLGRVEASRFIATGAGKGFTQLDVRVTDPEAIQKIVDGRYLTVSTHGVPIKDGSEYSFVKCSICNDDMLKDEWCGHNRGMSYEDEETGESKTCYWTVGAMEYKEVSVVNTPADNDGNVAAQITNIAMLDGEEPLLDEIAPAKGNLTIFADSEVEYASTSDFDEKNVANLKLWDSVNKDKARYVEQKGLIFKGENIEDSNKNEQELDPIEKDEPIVEPKQDNTKQDNASCKCKGNCDASPDENSSEDKAIHDKNYDHDLNISDNAMEELLDKGETYIEVSDGKQKMTIWVKYDGSKFTADVEQYDKLVDAILSCK